MDLKEIAKDIRNILDSRREDIGLTFEEETHKYTMNDGLGFSRSDWPSVSKVMKIFYDEFPADEIAEKKANGDPVEKARLLKEWADAGTYSTNMGSRTHYFLEQETIKLFGDYKDVRQPIFECDFEQILKSDSMITAGKDFLSIMIERGAVLLDTEIVLGDPDLGYTGQPDKVWVIMNKEQTEFGLVITDWKTNKPKNFEVSYFTKPMKYPFQAQPNNALGHYFTQLPFYGKLILKMLEGTKYENIKLYGCIIVLIKEDGEYEEFRIPREVQSTILNMDMQPYLSKLRK